MNHLHAMREEIVANLQNSQRPESLQWELLAEVRTIDAHLADQALFLANDELYELPPLRPQPIEPDMISDDQDVLF